MQVAPAGTRRMKPAEQEQSEHALLRFLSRHSSTGRASSRGCSLLGRGRCAAAQCADQRRQRATFPTCGRCADEIKATAASQARRPAGRTSSGAARRLLGSCVCHKYMTDVLRCKSIRRSAITDFYWDNVRKNPEISAFSGHHHLPTTGVSPAAPKA
jgi:hypothetical protein